MFREIVAVPRNHYALLRRERPGYYRYVGMALTALDARLWSRGVPGIPVVPPSPKVKVRRGKVRVLGNRN